ncbi:MAG: site-specific DNA-methyltransferase [Planctomycetes bacterium]|nr:site-specific DNA-methyltransferase [Planctomycetota bacterium]
MKTTHRIIGGDARRLAGVEDGSVQLIVTSPPYPMIEMWDGVFASLSPAAAGHLSSGDGPAAFEAMHRELDLVWRRCHRLLAPGGLACINVGDATRTIDGEFRLYSNHSRIILAMEEIGFSTLPDILWRKPTNAPNKFLGSGMLPAGAYVTYEHEYILIFRKGARRTFAGEDAARKRRESAFFWEERNVWFSDVWMDLRGARQELGDPEARQRSGAFPFELAYRLILMHSVAGDAVLDPFAGTGTTCAAALASARSSIGVEIDETLHDSIRAALRAAAPIGRRRAMERLEAHREFIRRREAEGRPPKYTSRALDVPVVTRQEVDLRLHHPVEIRKIEPHLYEAEHSSEPPAPEQTCRQLELDLGAADGP